MAIQEHAYYGSFGYHVTNFFAVSFWSLWSFLFFLRFLSLSLSFSLCFSAVSSPSLSLFPSLSLSSASSDALFRITF